MPPLTTALPMLRHRHPPPTDCPRQVLVVANPANTNALMLKEHAPSIPAENITALTRLDHNRALAQVRVTRGRAGGTGGQLLARTHPSVWLCLPCCLELRTPMPPRCDPTDCCMPGCAAGGRARDRGEECHHLGQPLINTGVLAWLWAAAAASACSVIRGARQGRLPGSRRGEGGLCSRHPPNHNHTTTTPQSQ
jgi:hypothetical protein